MFTEILCAIVAWFWSRFPSTVPRFSALKPSWGLWFLRTFGFVVWRTSLTPRQVQELIALYHQWVGEHENTRGHGLRTWSGIRFEDGIGQSEFLWRCRTLPEFRQIYSEWYQTNALLTSFDGCGAFYGSEHDIKQKNWLHIDLNYHILPRWDVSVQSILNLVDVTDPTRRGGSLVVVPGSHRRVYDRWRRGDATLQPFIDGKHGTKLKLDDPEYRRSRVLLPLRAGEIVSWLSGTVHQNELVPLPPRVPVCGRLLRLVAYVCFSPWDVHVGTPLAPKSRDDLIRERVAAAHAGWTTSHWPSLSPLEGRKCHTQNNGKHEFTDAERRLLHGTE